MDPTPFEGLFTPPPGSRERFGGLIPRYYEFVDEAVGKVLAAADADTDVVVISDHGSGPADDVLAYHLNPVLARLGLPERAMPTETLPSGRDLPRETILEALRRQFIPKAILCLRADRRGRARHTIRAELVVRLATREVTDVEVNGELAAPLRVCLGEALEHLVLPGAAAPMIVRYPIHTIEADVPPVIELDAETESALERSMGVPAAPR